MTATFGPCPHCSAALSYLQGAAGSTMSPKCPRCSLVGICLPDEVRYLTVGDGTVITAQSGVPNDVPPHAFYSGYPAVENRQWLKMMAALQQLPELQKRVRELESQLEGRKT